VSEIAGGTHTDICGDADGTVCVCACRGTLHGVRKPGRDGALLRRMAKMRAEASTTTPAQRRRDPVRLDATNRRQDAVAVRTAQVAGKSNRHAGRDIEDRAADDFDTLVSDAKRDPAPHGDKLLTALVRRQTGWSDPARVVSPEELDTAIANGWSQVWRGVSGAGDLKAVEMSEATRTGAWEMGKGIYGNGIYTSPRRSTAEVYRGHEPAIMMSRSGPYEGQGRWEPDGLREWAGDLVTSYGGNPGGLMRMAIDPDAKIIDFVQLQREHRAWLDTQDADAWKWFSTASDSSWYAVMRGYDGVHIKGEDSEGDGAYYPDDVTDEQNADQVIIFNRTVLMIEEASDRYDP
jgi:hypothetical protein